jgi:hypothetical protein
VSFDLAHGFQYAGVLNTLISQFLDHAGTNCNRIQTQAGHG